MLKEGADTKAHDQGKLWLSCGRVMCNKFIYQLSRFFASTMVFNVLNVRIADYIREVDTPSAPSQAPQSAKRKQRAPEATNSPDSGLSGPRKKVLSGADVIFSNNVEL